MKRIKNYKKFINFTPTNIQIFHRYSRRNYKNFKIIQTNGEIKLSLYGEMLKNFKFAPFYKIFVPILLEK